MSRFTFFEDQNAPILVKKPVVAANVANSDPLPVEQFRYRCEQSVVLKQNGMVKTHAETKREFLVSKINSSTNKGFTYDVNIVDSIISFYPSSMQDMMNLVSEIDKIKCNAVIQPDPDTGKIKAVLNHEKINENWKAFKKELQDKYAFIRDQKTKNDIAQFIAALDHQFSHQQSLIIDLNTKMFFDLFFDKYLVGKDDFSTPYTLNFNSQFFNDIPLQITMQPVIMAENTGAVSVTKLSKLEKTPALIQSIEAAYNQRIKPTIGYKFSVYDFSYRVVAEIDTQHNLINEATMYVLEEIKNNAQLLTNYTIKRVEL